MISVRNLTKNFGRFTAVDDLSFDVVDGEAVALWGPNGAGKTTVIRCMLGLLRCRGAITVAGQNVRRHGKAARRAIGYVPQEIAFYDEFGAAEMLRFFARLKRTPRRRVDEVLEEVGLTPHRRKRVRELSGGMKQRLALASALLADPPLLILDELTSNLDATAQAGFMTLLRNLKRQGKTILFTSHRFDEVEGLADRVLLLDAGRLKEIVPPGHVARTERERCILKVFIENCAIDEALATLARGGFTAQRNGCSVHVAVSPLEKVAPIRTLDEADIRVSNFELSNEDVLGLFEDGGRNDVQ